MTNPIKKVKQINADYKLLDAKSKKQFWVDGILNNARLSGIGTLQFAGANELILDENLAGYCLMYTATHGNDDIIEEEE